MDLRSKKVLVFGAGKSGIGAADLLGNVGAQPVSTMEMQTLTKKPFYIKQMVNISLKSGQEIFRKERLTVLIL